MKLGGNHEDVRKQCEETIDALKAHADKMKCQETKSAARKARVTKVGTPKQVRFEKLVHTHLGGSIRTLHEKHEFHLPLTRVLVDKYGSIQVDRLTEELGWDVLASNLQGARTSLVVPFNVLITDSGGQAARISIDEFGECQIVGVPG